MNKNLGILAERFDVESPFEEIGGGSQGWDEDEVERLGKGIETGTGNGGGGVGKDEDEGVDLGDEMEFGFIFELLLLC